MNILPASGPGPVGAAALLAYADEAELERFQAIEDAVWSGTSLTPAVTETVRLRCAQVRGCRFCAAVRVKAAIEDGLSESHIAKLDATDRGVLSEPQRAALALVDRFLLEPHAPDDGEAGWVAGVLGARGILEVLLACAAFATAELRIALGENLEPSDDAVVERRRGVTTAASGPRDWPSHVGPVLDPGTRFPEIDRALAQPVEDLVVALWSGEDLSPGLVAACIVRASQLFDLAGNDPSRGLVVPSRAAESADPVNVRDWPAWPPGRNRAVMMLGEQLWIDPSGVDETVINPLREFFDVGGIIRVAWDLIWIGQLERLALVLHRGSSMLKSRGFAGSNNG